MQQLEEENLKLKRLIADPSLDKALLQHVLEKRADVDMPAHGVCFLVNPCHPHHALGAITSSELTEQFFESRNIPPHKASSNYIHY